MSWETDILIKKIGEMRGEPIPEVLAAREVIEESFRRPRRTRVSTPTEQPSTEIVTTMAQAFDPLAWIEELLGGAARAADIILPEEVLGLDITPGWHYFPGGGRAKQYGDVYIKGGKIYAGSAGDRMLGYTSAAAKKKFRTKRRRKRLTKRDMYILEVLKANPQAGALALML